MTRQTDAPTASVFDANSYALQHASDLNVMWMWAALLGLNISSWLQALTGHDQADGRAHGKRLRRELVCIAARVTNHAGRLEVHPSPEDHHGYFGDAWRTLDVLIAAKSP